MFSPSLMRASEAGHPICLGIALVYSYWICYHCIFNESVTSVTFPVIFSINLSLWNFKKLFGSREKEFVSLFLAVLLRVVIKSRAHLITRWWGTDRPPAPPRQQRRSCSSLFPGLSTPSHSFQAYPALLCIFQLYFFAFSVPSLLPDFYCPIQPLLDFHRHINFFFHIYPPIIDQFRLF